MHEKNPSSEKGTILITGSSGLVGSEAVKFFAQKGFNVVGIDNNMRKYFFGKDGNTKWQANILKKTYPNFKLYEVDIRNFKALEKIFSKYEFKLVIHAAAQPSHDWSTKDPITDFSVNANATLNLLVLHRKYCPKAIFIFTSTNKVYGDTPNTLPLIELETRYEIDPKSKRYANGIDETQKLDRSTHSFMGISKTAADLLVQEYANYFGLKTVVFRCGCITGSAHSGTQLHGFLSYLARCIAKGKTYTILGYKGKQVRDNIHAYDLVKAFWHFFKKPQKGEVFNMGGGRYSNISILEAIEKIEKLLNIKAKIRYVDKPRIGDHIWYISDISKFKSQYPKWNFSHDIDDILEDILKGSGFL